jgi:hypothetical protein
MKPLSNGIRPEIPGNPDVELGDRRHAVRGGVAPRQQRRARVGEHSAVVWKFA